MLEKVSVLVMSSGNPDLLGDLELLWKMVVVVWMHVAGILMVIERLKQNRGFWTLKSDRITDGERGWMDAVAIGTKKYHSCGMINICKQNSIIV